MLLFSVDHSYCSLPPHPVSAHDVDQVFQALQSGVRGAEKCHVGVRENLGERFPSQSLYRCIDRYFGDASTELTVLGRIMSSVPDDCKLVSLIGGSHTLIQTYSGYSGSGNTQKVVDQAVFDLRLLRRCMQKSASVVFGSMDPFSMTEFVIVRLKGALHKDWMQTRPCLRKAIETGELVMPSLPDVVFDICSVWPLGSQVT